MLPQPGLPTFAMHIFKYISIALNLEDNKSKSYKDLFIQRYALFLFLGKGSENSLSTNFVNDFSGKNFVMLYSIN